MTDAEIQKLIDDANKSSISLLFIYPMMIEDAIYCCDSAGYKKVTASSSSLAQHIANTCPYRIVPLLEELLCLRNKLSILKQGLMDIGEECEGLK